MTPILTNWFLGLGIFLVGAVFGWFSADRKHYRFLSRALEDCEKELAVERRLRNALEEDMNHAADEINRIRQELREPL